MYLLNHQELNPGDIILQSGTTKFSSIIKNATDSDYSHAMIYVGNSLIHALTDGVYSINPQRILVTQPNHFKVLRTINPLYEQRKNIIVNHARNLTGSIYSIYEASLSPVLARTKKATKSKQQFCSRLVAQSYQAGGIFIVSNPDFCTPEDINRSSALTEIHGVVRAATEQEITFTQTEDPIRENQRRLLLWLNAARIIFLKRGIDIQTENDVDSSLLENKDLDSIICNRIIESGFMTHYDFDKEVNSYRYNSIEFLEKCTNEYHASEIFSVDIDKEPNFIKRHSENYRVSKIKHITHGLKFHEIYAQLYINLLMMSHSRIFTLKKVAETFKWQNRIEYCNIQLGRIEQAIDLQDINGE